MEDQPPPTDNVPNLLHDTMNTRHLVDPSAAERTVVTDLVVVGSGIAGMVAALKASRFCRVSLVTKSELKEGATRYAQGGVAIAVGKGDSPRLHMEDTMRAGAGLCDEAPVQVLVNEGVEAFDELIGIGAQFDADQGEVSLRREGGHSVARVVHSGDTTGSEIERALSASLKESENIEIYEHGFLVDVLTDDSGACTGVAVWAGNELVRFKSRAVLLATGGAGQIYSGTTNPLISTGDGISSAYRAGARVADMEFVQFHPTALFGHENPMFLLSEALRGEGAYIVDSDGNRFMDGIHPLAELAPRDIVVRAMAERMREAGAQNMFLDLRHLDQAELQDGFPAIMGRLRTEGYDPSTDLIPVTFAAHYLVGGIATDGSGRTSIKGLYASGETACTGIHGANRLASNSLLEGLVFSGRAVQDLEGYLESQGRVAVEDEFGGSGTHDLDGVPDDYGSGMSEKIRAETDEFRARATEGIGELRTPDGLIRFTRVAEQVMSERREVEPSDKDCVHQWELFNLAQIGFLIATAAYQRNESRGTHLRGDFPEPDESWSHRHILMTRDQVSMSDSVAAGIEW